MPVPMVTLFTCFKVHLRNQDLATFSNILPRYTHSGNDFLYLCSRTYRDSVSADNLKHDIALRTRTEMSENVEVPARISWSILLDRRSRKSRPLTTVLHKALTSPKSRRTSLTRALIVALDHRATATSSITISATSAGNQSKENAAIVA